MLESHCKNAHTGSEEQRDGVRGTDTETQTSPVWPPTVKYACFAKKGGPMSTWGHFLFYLYFEITRPLIVCVVSSKSVHMVGKFPPEEPSGAVVVPVFPRVAGRHRRPFLTT